MSRIRIEEKHRLVREWDKSGLTAAEFARRRGLRPETLMRWGRAVRGPLERRSRKRAAARSVALVEVPSAGLFGSEPRIEIALRTGRRLTLFADFSPAVVAEIARALEDDR